MVGKRRFLQLASKVRSNAEEIVLTLSQPEVVTAALELALLLNRLAESLRIGPGDGLRLKVVDDDRRSKAVVTRERDGTLVFELGTNQAGYLYATLLRAYRDEAAEANHLHIEGEIGKQLFDLTVMFEVFQAPLSAEEAKKRLSEP